MTQRPAAMSALECHQKEIAALSAVMRTLLEAELAAGNEIVEVGHSFPAPPIGAYFRLSKPLQTRSPVSGDGIDYYDRNGSTYSGEITDSLRFYFLLEPPHPPAPEPDMNAIRAEQAMGKAAFRELGLQIGVETSVYLGDSKAAAPSIESEDSDYRVEVDCRGEMLTYCEPGRSAQVICTFGNGPCLLPRTMSNWLYAADRRSVKMTEMEKKMTLDRIAGYCRKHHGMANLVFET